MLVEQFYTGCLAQAAYYIESNGESAIIDPLRDVDVYISKAKDDKAKIKYVFETHFHADFVSGHLDLAVQTGAAIVYGPTAQPGFDAIIATDGQEFKIGDLIIKVLHTPGHTLESCCYLLIDETGKEKVLFSGDTIFLGDVGRSDLAQKAANMTQEELAGMLYDSIQKKIMPLADDIMVYPAHGAGSACGKKMCDERVDTLGHQKVTNYALRKGITKNEFIQEVLTGLTPPPQYFPYNVAMNKQGYSDLTTVINKGTKLLTVGDVEKIQSQPEVLLLDTRKPADFVKGFIAGSINIGIDGDFAPWAGTLITNIQQPIAIIAQDGRVEEVITRLARVGYDNCIGYLDGGIDAWKDAGKQLETVESISAEEFANRLETRQLAFVIDARRQSEFDAEHVVGAENVPLNHINERMKEFDNDPVYYVYCAGGYRSVIFISIMNSRGYKNLVNVEGGFNSIKKNGRLQVSHYVEPIRML